MIMESSSAQSTSNIKIRRHQVQPPTFHLPTLDHEAMDGKGEANSNLICYKDRTYHPLEPSSPVHLTLSPKRSPVDRPNPQLSIFSQRKAEPGLRNSSVLPPNHEVIRMTNYRVSSEDEVKPAIDFDGKVVTPLARNLHSATIDQFGRSLSKVLLLNKDMCRMVWCDNSGYYVTATLSYPLHPGRFIQLVGLLAAPDPHILGYGLSLSNAGKVGLSYALKNTRTLLATPPTPDRDPLKQDTNGAITLPNLFTPRPSKGQDRMDFVLRVASLAHPDSDDAIGWELALRKAEPGRAKQDRQNSPHPQEGALYLAINGVWHFVFLHGFDHTRKCRQFITLSDDRRRHLPRRKKAALLHNENPNKVVPSTSFLSSRITHNGSGATTERWTTSNLDQLRTLRRDISLGNILLTLNQPLEVLLINLGVTKKVSEGAVCRECDLDRHPMGTVAFTAADPLPGADLWIPRHAPDYDIESLFWVLLWTCVTLSGLDKPTTWMDHALSSLNADAVPETVGEDRAVRLIMVGKSKEVILAKWHIIHIGGKFHSVTPFLQEFAWLCAPRNPGRLMPSTKSWKRSNMTVLNISRGNS
ncbi:hypothetical protein FRB94_000590 [Tulasnella sp. JGI-2019a]|nr:hypothetical protein FRB93_013726 [Tulasnella sp. JGI-2019a]KAG9006573.1 hypothetical protein FRB94_000590 [Tulasnella sp. JGI-2019a]